MFKWILYYALPFTIVATKADKLPKSKREQAAAAAAKGVGAPAQAIAFSAQDKRGKASLIKRIGEIVSDYDCVRAE